MVGGVEVAAVGHGSVGLYQAAPAAKNINLLICMLNAGC